MTDKKEGPGQKDASKKPGDRDGGESGAGKRPFATIDLRAVEVGEEASRQGPVAPKAAEPPKPKAPDAAQPRAQAEAAQKVAAAAAAVRPGAASPGASVPAAGSKATAEAAKGGEPTAGRTPSPAPSPGGAPPQPARSGGLGRILSHTFAGLLGGALALLGGPHLMPHLKDLGLPPAPPAPVAPEILQRLATLERTVATPPAVDPGRDPARAIATADANRNRIEDLQKRILILGEGQAQTAKLAAELKARLEKEPPIADAAERIVQLEKQLAMLAEVARSEPDRAGRIPQIAQLAGRISDIEAATASRAAELRKELIRELEGRIQPSTEASEAARVISQRIEREVGTLKVEANRIATGLDQVKTQSERLQLSLKSAQDDTAQLATSLEGVRRDLDGRIRTLAKPADISAAVAPLAGQVTSLEKNLSSVVKSETERNATAERIVLSLELGNLKRAMERGAPYAGELAEVKRSGGGRLDLAALERHRETGVPTIAALTQEFRQVANALLDADAEKGDGSVVDRLLSGAKTFVRVRRTTAASGDQSPEAVVARMETALKGGRLGDVLAEAKALSRQPQEAKDWLAKVEARQTVDGALKAIDQALKAALGGGAGEAQPAQKKGQP